MRSAAGIGCNEEATANLIAQPTAAPIAAAVHSLVIKIAGSPVLPIFLLSERRSSINSTHPAMPAVKVKPTVPH